MQQNKNRILPSILPAFMEYTEHLPTPEIFRLWSAIAVVGAAMSRRCWVKTKVAPIYCGLMLILCGKSGIGKSPPINTAEYFLRKIDYSKNVTLQNKGIRIGPQRITSSGLFDFLSYPSASKTYKYGADEFIFQNANFIAAEATTMLSELRNGHQGDELGAYLVKFLDAELMDRKLSKDETEMMEITHPSGLILAGIQPDLVFEYFPEKSWSMGFAARAIFVFSNEHSGQSYFGTDDTISLEEVEQLQEDLEPKIVHDLEQIAEMSGPFTLDPDAYKFFDSWWHKGRPTDQPTHPMLQSYSAKRGLQLVRLSMIVSASRSSSRHIITNDIKIALSFLQEAEKRMPELFSSLTKDESDNKIIENLINFIEAFEAVKGLPVPEHLVRSNIGNSVPAGPRIDAIIDELLNQKIIVKVKPNPPMPGRAFRLNPKRETS